MAVTATTRLGVTLWSDGGDPFTRVQMNASHNALESNAAIYLQGTAGARPAAGTVGRFYFATDTLAFSYDDGVAWQNVSDPSTVLLAATQTLTNKTLTNPTINAATITGAFASTATITGGTVNPTTLQQGSVQAILASGTQTIANGLTITTPIIASIKTNAGSSTLTLPTTTDTLVGRATTDTLTNKSLTSPALLSPKEPIQISASAATGTIALYAETAQTYWYTTNASANFIVNLRQNSGTTLASVMSVGQTATFIFLCTNGATPYYCTGVQIDSTMTGVTTRWQYIAPANGYANSVDAYTFTVTKTGASTFTVFASQAPFVY